MKFYTLRPAGRGRPFGLHVRKDGTRKHHVRRIFVRCTERAKPLENRPDVPLVSFP